MNDDRSRTAREELEQAFERRFGERVAIPDDIDREALAKLARIAARSSHRSWSDRAVSQALVALLVRTALTAPSKSDLQQADFVDIRDAGQRQQIAALVPSMPWVATAPAFLVVCGNNRRIRRICAERRHPFANDHLDAFFNAAVDGGIHLSFLLMAAEAIGLGGCPVSVIRNESRKVSDILGLPDHVFAVAGLALGWPAGEGSIVPRLSPRTTFHTDRYRDAEMEEIEAYDRRRQAVAPYDKQRRTDLFGECADYGWMEEKARHYALSERADFGEFVRSKGFRLD
ncbi:MAG: nitroreductase family protein [Geminicoccaceae bacterium]